MAMEPRGRLFSPLLSRVRPLASARFCSSSSSSSSPPSGEFISFFSSSSGGGGRGEAGEGDSSVYRRALLTQRPPTVKVNRLRRNSCSFIGSVAFSPRRFKVRTGGFGVYTVLEVKRPPSASNQPSPFRICLAIWNELAEIAFRHLNQDDVIYAWGHLSSYVKTDESGKGQVFQQLDVKDLNYVRWKGQGQISTNPENLDEANRVPCSGEQDHESEAKNRLLIWQLFFSNPHEWWDNRQSKNIYPGRPDFRHKETHECLTLRPDDPPWVRKQLQLYDSEMVGLRGYCRGGPRVSEWNFEE